MRTQDMSRRGFLSGATAFGAAAGAAALWDPAQMAAQVVGVKKGDLPDLTIKEVKIYVTNMEGIHKLNGTETGEIISVVTHSGIEGNYTLGDRNRTANWLEWAKPALVGKNVVDVLPDLTSTSGIKTRGNGFDASLFGRRPRSGARRRGAFGAPPRLGEAPAFDSAEVSGSGLQMRGAGSWPNYYTAAADVALWDILGKAVNRPIYQLLSGGVRTKDRVLAYASSQHLPNVEAYVPDVMKAKQQGYKGYKIHPGNGQHATGPRIPTYMGHMEEIREVRKAAGDDYVLAFDPVQGYNQFEALTVGRLMDELDYLWFEDPMTDIDEVGLIELVKRLNTGINVGEFLYSIADFAEYIKRDALTIVRPIVDNVGGISGGMRVGLLADAHGYECQPHNWGNVYDLTVAFHLELALPNAYWFEMPFPPEYADRPYFSYKFRIDQDGYVPAPTGPGLGYPLDRAGLEKVMLRVET